MKKEKEEMQELISECLKNAETIKYSLRKMIFPETSDEWKEFSELPRVEQVAFIGLLQNASDLLQNLHTYKSWFIDKK